MPKRVVLALFMLCLVPITAHASSFGDGLSELAGLAGVGSGGLPDNSSTSMVLGRILEWLLSIVGVVTILVIIYAGYQLIVGTGNDDQMSKAKRTLLWAIVGLVIVLMAWFIIDTVLCAARGC